MARSHARPSPRSSHGSHALWTGQISFGLVNVPVRLVAAVVDRGLHFHQLHDKDGGRIHEKRVCSIDGEEVPFEHIVKGYDVRRGRTIQLAPGELEPLGPEENRSIAIEDFVPLAQINPLYFQHPYYLIPDAGAEASYALLRTVMERSERVAIGRMVMRGKQYLTALRPLGPALSLSTLWYADEVILPERLEGLSRAAKIGSRELVMAQQLVDSLATDFDPGKYPDTYREKVSALLERKAKGEPLPKKTAERAPAKVLDLTSALQASLAATARAAERTGTHARTAKANRRTSQARGTAKTAHPRARSA